MRVGTRRRSCYDAIKRAKVLGSDYIICDTATVGFTRRSI